MTAPVAGPRRAVRQALLPLVTLVVSVVVLYLAWALFVHTGGVSPFIAKSPSDVWGYVFSGEDAAGNRSALLSGYLTTLLDAAIGFVAGVVGGLLVAAVFALYAPLEVMFFPIALMLRSVPLVALAPLLGILFGRGVAGAAAIGGIVILFPVLVNVAVGFRSTSPQAIDLIRVNGGSKWTVLAKVAVPSALPNLLASVRISVPAAFVGAMLYEWLFSGQGLGSAIITAPSQLDYNLVWSVAVLVTITSIVLYNVVGVIEVAVLARWGPDAGRA